MRKLKDLRAEYGISQQRLADVLNVSQQSINKYENNHAQPDIETLKKMADHFNTSIDYLVGYTDIRRKLEHTEEYRLNDDEVTLVQTYRWLNKKQRSCIQIVIDAFKK